MGIIVFEKKVPLDKEEVDDFAITCIDIDEKTNLPISFSIMQFFYAVETTHEILRYDCAHGFVHVHKFFENLNHSGEPLNKKICEKTFDECWDDIQNNWKNYKALYLKKHQR